jgi:putative membrane protein
MNRDTGLLIAAFALILILIVSGISPYERGTWLLEVFPVIAALPLLFFTYRRFPLTTLLYVLIFVHSLILIYGGIHTYARVPLGFWMQDYFALDRNPYDKIGHFAQGFVPAIAAREVLLRGAYVRGRRMLAFLVICVVLAVSAVYELIEYATAMLLGGGAVDFLGTQGDPWDTQKDMLFALIGAVTALVLLSRLHDRQIAQVDPRYNSGRA